MKCLNFNFQELFFRFRPQGPAIGSKVTKNGIFETFCLKAFSVEKLEMPFLEYKSLNVSRRGTRILGLTSEISDISWKSGEMFEF